MFILVTKLWFGTESAEVLVYATGARAPLHKADLPLDAFPHEPAIGERFELVVA